jgi:hypothetical protein
MTRAGFEYVLEMHVQIASGKLPDLKGRSVSSHQLRHSCAVIMLQAPRDIRKVALELVIATCARPRFIFVSIHPKNWKPWRQFFRQACVAGDSRLLTR